MAKLVSKVYGEALFEIAMEEKKSDRFLKEVRDILTVLEQNPQLNKLINHPGISGQEKEEMVDRIFGKLLSKELRDFVKLLIDKKRYAELPRILHYFVERMMEEKRIGVAYVTTAMDLTEVQKKAVENRLLQTTDYTSMEIHYQVDQAIIGGIIIRIKGRVVDNSIRTGLEELKKQLLQIRLD